MNWKTYWRSRPRPELARDWQTRLYLFLLAETSDYAPEQLRLTYWFVQVSPQPQAITFTYDRAQHEQTRQDLQNLLSDLKTAITDYQAGESLTQVPLSAGQCDRCPFARRCDRAGDAPTAETQDWQAAIAPSMKCRYSLQGCTLPCEATVYTQVLKPLQLLGFAFLASFLLLQQVSGVQKPYPA